MTEMIALNGAAIKMQIEQVDNSKFSLESNAVLPAISQEAC